MARNEAVFFDVKCGKYEKKFYARYDYAYDGVWVLSYGVKEIPRGSSAGGFGSSTLKINLSNSRTGPQYRCPYCGNGGFCRCGDCGKLTCYGGEAISTCVHCGSSGEVGGVIQDLYGGDAIASQK